MIDRLYILIFVTKHKQKDYIAVTKSRWGVLGRCYLISSCAGTNELTISILHALYYYNLNYPTHLAGQTCVLHGRKWNFPRPQVYLQPAKVIENQYFEVSLKLMV